MYKGERERGREGERERGREGEIIQSVLHSKQPIVDNIQNPQIKRKLWILGIYTQYCFRPLYSHILVNER